MELKTELEKIDFKKVERIVISSAQKFTGEPFSVKNGAAFLFETVVEKKAFHDNVPIEKIPAYIEEKAAAPSNVVIFDSEKTVEFKLTKKNKLLKNVSKTIKTEKQEGFSLPKDIPALVDLGVVSKDFFIVKGMYDKFKQIEQFTALIYAEAARLKSAKVKIVDCGCGKAYLSFVIYHYLKIVKNIDVQITGVDLKAEVVQNLNDTAKKYGYSGMTFVCKDIFDAEEIFQGADILISLHACDKATDYALFNAVKNSVPLIFCSPCCQQQFLETFDSKNLKLLNQYGLIKERLSALFTDSIRASLLVYCGYKTKIAEFVPLAHSPKNIMIKAQKSNLSDSVKADALAQVEALLNEFGGKNELYNLIFQL